MSRVQLLAADCPLPSADYRSLRTKAALGVSLTMEMGFQVSALSFCKSAVEASADIRRLAMKPCRYELSIEEDAEDLAHFRAYLRENCPPGGEIQLWALRLGEETRRPPRFRGCLEEFDLETLRQFLEAEEICLTVTV